MKHVANRRRMSTRMLVALLAIVLVIGCVAGGTIAWLKATSETVTNTFTYGDININLTETAGEKGTDENNRSFKIIPGTDISKDPKVTVKAGSEACWLFVEVTENNWADYLTYAPADGWDVGTGTGEGGNGVPTNVYFRKVPAADANKDITYNVLAGSTTYTNGVIHVDGAKLTKEIANEATKEGKLPQLIFTAYAVQSENVADAAAAWAIAKPANP